MTYQSEHVKIWRKRTKLRAVAAFGNKCCICNYERCAGALEFHHLEPDGKDFGISHGDTMSWSKVVAELRKCVMLCSNCHKEVHAGLVSIPNNANRFDETYDDYRKNYPVEIDYKRKVDWTKIDLLKELETKSLQQIADQLKCSKSNIVKRRNLLAGTLAVSGGAVNAL